MENTPIQLQNLSNSPDIFEISEKIGTEFGLHIDQIGELDAQIREVMKGRAKSEDFIDDIKKYLEVNSDIAAQIAEKVNIEIKNILKITLQGTQVPQEQNPIPENVPQITPKPPVSTIASTPPSPKPVENTSNQVPKPTNTFTAPTLKPTNPIVEPTPKPINTPPASVPKPASSINISSSSGYGYRSKPIDPRPHIASIEKAGNMEILPDNGNKVEGIVSRNTPPENKPWSTVPNKKADDVEVLRGGFSPSIADKLINNSVANEEKSINKTENKPSSTDPYRETL